MADDTLPPMATQSSSILGNVPFDILVHFLSFLGPLDLLAVGQTCKLLQEATLQRSLWIDILRRVCAENHIFCPTYPIDDMATSDIVEAALTPARFLSFIYKKRDPTNSTELPTLGVRLTPGNLNRRRNRCPIDLLPGGRFLVCAEYKIMSIWDLGYPSERCSLSDPVLVATVATEECNRFLLKPTADALGIQAIILSQPAGNISVFEIHPTSSDPSFRKTASLDIILHEAWEDAYCLCGDRFFIVFRGVVNVWDFSRNLWASWETIEDPGCISATDDYVILVEDDHEARVGLWKIPPLQPIGSTSTPLGVLPADIWFTLPDDMIPQYYGGLDDWYLTGGVGQTRRIIDGYRSTAEYSGRVGFHRVELPLTLSVNEETYSPNNDDLDIHFFDLPTSGNIFGSLGICNQNAISVWASDLGLQFHATRQANIVNRPGTPVDLTPSPRFGSVQIKMPGNTSPQVAGFCPVSGRLCYLLHGDSVNTIYITDCLFRNPL